jgi:hypothetical protein
LSDLSYTPAQFDGRGPHMRQVANRSVSVLQASALLDWQMHGVE